MNNGCNRYRLYEFGLAFIIVRIIRPSASHWWLFPHGFVVSVQVGKKSPRLGPKTNYKHQNLIGDIGGNTKKMEAIFILILLVAQ